MMMSKRPTPIADFMAFPVRLTVSLAPFSVFSAFFIYEQRVLPVEYGLLCGLSFVRAFCTALC